MSDQSSANIEQGGAGYSPRPEAPTNPETAKAWRSAIAHALDKTTTIQTFVSNGESDLREDFSPDSRKESFNRTPHDSRREHIISITIFFLSAATKMPLV